MKTTNKQCAKTLLKSLEIMFQGFVGSDLSETYSPIERLNIYTAKKQIEKLIKADK